MTASQFAVVDGLADQEALRVLFRVVDTFNPSCAGERRSRP